jgi:hypothetical protein
MRKFGLLVAFGLLLTGAAPCGGGDDDEGSGEGDGSQGGAGTAGHAGGSAGEGRAGGGGEGPAGGGGRAGSSVEPGGGGAGMGTAGGDAGGGTAGGDDDPPDCEGSSDTPCPGSGDGVECGPNTCDEGQVCCNESCGICTEPDGFCTEQACEPSPGESCDLTCDAGQHCELVQVACIQAPCPPQPECVPSPQCGGFAGFTCPGEGECLDVPDDSCDPEMGGADCGGYCSCSVGPLIDCAPDTTFDPSPEVCACVKPTTGGDGVECGDTTCASDEVCCNESCGICTPPGDACTQVLCN